MKRALLIFLLTLPALGFSQELLEKSKWYHGVGVSGMGMMWGYNSEGTLTLKPFLFEYYPIKDYYLKTSVNIFNYNTDPYKQEILPGFFCPQGDCDLFGRISEWDLLLGIRPQVGRFIFQAGVGPSLVWHEYPDDDFGEGLALKNDRIPNIVTSQITLKYEAGVRFLINPDNPRSVWSLGLRYEENFNPSLEFRVISFGLMLQTP